MTPAGGNRAAGRLNRRDLLRAGALGAIIVPLALPALAGCTNDQESSAPDPLITLVTAAGADARMARAFAAVFPDNAATLQVAASVREQQAAALQAEINRASNTTTSTSASATASSTPAVPGSEAAAMSQLTGRLRAAQQQAATLVPTVPRYRAGLVGSVSAGCASLVEALGG
ncbi:MAG TPA: hypothetical protein VF444_15185 [Pseudonocardiaceae bacterium]